jgi:heme iron utilization protein
LALPSDDRAIARLLLRASRTAALATIDRAAGGPLATLVSLGGDFDGAPLMLFSQLSQHTKNLAADPRASLLLSSREGRDDPLNRPRLSLSGGIAPHRDAGARARFLRQNLKSRLYAGFGDFGIYRMEIDTLHFNGGFGKAAALERDDVLTRVEAAGDLLESEEALLGRLNAIDGPLAARLAREPADASRRWRARSLDPDGADLASGAATARIAFEAPALNAGDWLRALEEASRFERF